MKFNILDGLVNNTLKFTNFSVNQVFIIINLIHILIVASLFLSIGIYKSNTPKWIVGIVGIIGLLLPIIVGLPNMTMLTLRTFIRIFHIIVGLSLVIFSITFMKDSTKISDDMYSSFIGLALTIISYHIYKLILRVKKL